MNQPRIVTIGVYGFDEQTFFGALQDAQVDLFCDIRRRRGVRGAQYAFANSQKLQARLAEMGIRYRHVLELAPTQEVRQLQEEADRSSKIARRKRLELDPAFVEAFRRERLDHFSPHAFMETVPQDVKVIAFCCVERAPEACHRSLVADLFARELHLEVEHIR